MSNAFVVTVLVSSLFGLTTSGQTRIIRPSFEVASVKLHTSADYRTASTMRGGRYVATAFTVRRLALLAYGSANSQLLTEQLLGGPSWIVSEHFDIEAKAPAGASAIPEEQVHLMLQSLLEDRFQLKIHREMKELPVFDLVVAKPGKMKLYDEQIPPDPNSALAKFPRGVARLWLEPSGMYIGGTAIPMSMFVNQLQANVGHSIVDKTDLQGLFDIRLPVTLNADLPTPVSSMPFSEFTGLVFTYLQEELGLRLESRKEPTEVFVIDNVKKPSSN